MSIPSRLARIVHHVFVAMVVGFGLGLLLPAGAGAAPGDVVRGKAADRGNVSVVRGESGLDVEVLFAPEDVLLVEQDGYSGVTVEGCELAEETPGHPWLPTKVINVLIPNGARVLGVEAQAEEVLLAGNVLVYPAQPQVPVSARLPAMPAFVGPDAAVYAATTKVPEVVAALAGQHSMRGYSFAAVRIQPVRYVPAARELYLATRITVRLQCSEPEQRALPPGRVGREAFSSAVAGIVVNPEMVAEEAAAADEVAGEQPAGLTDYLIITSSALAGTFQDLANHRSGRNEMTVAVVPLETITATYAGVDTQAKIRACIQDYVQNRGTAYVVLGGDDTIVPDRNCYVTCGTYIESGMPTDFYYAGLNGTWDEDGDGVYGEADTTAGDEGDLAADVYVGRIPVRTAAQATYYINKVIQFENSPIDSGKMILMGEHLGGGASPAYSAYAATDRPTDVVNDGLLNFASHEPISDTEMWTRRMYRDIIQPRWVPGTLGLFFDTLTSWDPGVAGSYAMSYLNMRTKLNLGWYHVFMMTHGSETIWAVEGGSFGTGDAAALTGRLGFIYTGSCMTARFDSATDPCLSEAFLRDAQGPVAYFGCSRYGWFSPDSPPASDYTTGGTSMDYARDFYDQFYRVPHNSLAQVFYAHKAVNTGYAVWNGADRWLQFGLNYQGDPALLVPAATRTLTVSVQGQGSVNLNPPGGTYNIGTNVLMTAVPVEPWEFVRWEADVTGTANPMMVSMDINRSVTAVFVLPGDVDGDGLVDVADLLWVVDSFGKNLGDEGYDPRCDFNHDDMVDVVDLLTLVDNFGT